MKIIKIDCDGVLRNLLPKICELYNYYYNESIKPADIKDYNLNNVLIKCKEDVHKWLFQQHCSYIYLNSPVCHKAKEAMDLLHQKGYYIIIVSKQPSFLNKENTILWLRENNIYYDSICFIDKKDVVKGDIVVDDYIENLKQCCEPEKILIDAPYNKKNTSFKKYNTLYEYVKTLE